MNNSTGNMSGMVQIDRPGVLARWLRSQTRSIFLLTLMLPSSLFIACNPTSESMSISAETLESPVVLDLFTAQGCSSCPPADRLLSRLQSEGHVHGREVIVLSHHVDYWNRLGWKDPYSSAQASERQEYYAKNLNSRRLYTPQMVIDGRYETVGHNEPGIRDLIHTSGADSRGSAISPEIQIQWLESSRVMVSVYLDRSLNQESLLVFLVQDGVQNSVPSGENANRTLAHDGVVRLMFHPSRGEINQEKDKPVFTDTITLPEPAPGYRLVALVQSHKGSIQGADQLELQKPN